MLLTSVLFFILSGSNYPAQAFEPETVECYPKNLDYIKFEYKDNIDGFNQAISLYEYQHPNYNEKSLVNYIYNPFLQRPADLAKCLRDLGVDPTTVAQVSPEFQRVLSLDPERLNETSPDFVRYVPIPEFGELSILSLSILISGIVILSKYGYKFGKHRN